MGTDCGRARPRNIRIAYDFRRARPGSVPKAVLTNINQSFCLDGLVCPKVYDELRPSQSLHSCPETTPKGSNLSRALPENSGPDR